MKTRQSISIEFGGQTLNYEIQQLPPTKAIKLLTRTIKLIGEPLLVMLTAGGKDISKVNVLDVLPGVARILREGLDETEVDYLIKEFMNCVFHGGQPVTPSFEVHFMGKLPVIFKLLVEVLKLNYADFLSEFAKGNRDN